MVTAVLLEEVTSPGTHFSVDKNHCLRAVDCCAYIYVRAMERSGSLFRGPDLDIGTTVGRASKCLAEDIARSKVGILNQAANRKLGSHVGGSG